MYKKHVRSASKCERICITHEFFHSKKINKLFANKLPYLANVHCNLNLWTRSLEGKTSSSKSVREVPSATSYDVGSCSRSVDDVKTSTNGMDDEEDEEMFRDKGMGTYEVEEISHDNDENEDAISFID